MPKSKIKSKKKQGNNNKIEKNYMVPDHINTHTTPLKSIGKIKLPKGKGTPNRRASLASRGRRLSLQVPPNVESSEMWKHIDPSLPDNVRLRMLVIWLGRRQSENEWVEKVENGDIELDWGINDFELRNSENSNDFKVQLFENKISKLSKECKEIWDPTNGMLEWGDDLIIERPTLKVEIDSNRISKLSSRANTLNQLFSQSLKANQLINYAVKHKNSVIAKQWSNELPTADDVVRLLRLLYN
ncbi:hypothetical protein DAMA08_036910 [Martiniozyma asiatica (nom. inval.)]|nr:hypothetical protein DAMA08_036910 [Martiniozyma asiatica]